MTKKEARKKLYWDQIKKGRSPFVFNMYKLANYNTKKYLDKIVEFLGLESLPHIYLFPSSYYIDNAPTFGLTQIFTIPQLHVGALELKTKYTTVDMVNGYFIDIRLIMGSMIKYTNDHRAFMDIVFVDFLVHELVHFKQALHNSLVSSVNVDTNERDANYNIMDSEVEARKLSGEFLLNHTDFDKDLVELVMKDCNF